MLFNDLIRDVFRQYGAVSCGLNADWCVEAWCLNPSRVEPNLTNGAYYILDDEDGEASLVRRFYPREEDPHPNPYDDECYDGDGHNDEVRLVMTRSSTVDGVRNLLIHFNALVWDSSLVREGWIAPRDKIRTEEQLAEERERCVKRYALSPFCLDASKNGFFICDGCELANRCNLAFDLYNTKGDCLLEK